MLRVLGKIELTRAIRFLDPLFLASQNALDRGTRRSEPVESQTLIYKDLACLRGLANPESMSFEGYGELVPGGNVNVYFWQVLGLALLLFPGYLKIFPNNPISRWARVHWAISNQIFWGSLAIVLLFRKEIRALFA